MNTVITLTLDEAQQKELECRYSAFRTDPPAWALFQLRPEGCTITCYSSGKTVFQGKRAEEYAAEYRKDDTVVLPQAGSDEVGTGDYFGPVCVAAVYLDRNSMPLIQKLGVRDSKQMTDDIIRRTAPHLMEHLIHSLLIVPPEKYNDIHRQYNMNAVKSLLHNQAYNSLKERIALPELMVIDQFTPERSYYRYLQGRGDIVTGIRFETKAENAYPAVGAASIIARYAFLRTMDRMEEEWQMNFAKGSGTAADDCAREFVRLYGRERLSQVAKIHFKNTERIS
ncbi:MAG: ribonuclease HIII [Solobacterium sp.]|nr:ribonuclease HIII [Solobacterium sp.]